MELSVPEVVRLSVDRGFAFRGAMAQLFNVARARRRRRIGGYPRFDDQTSLDNFLRTDVARLEHRRHVCRWRPAADEGALSDVSPNQSFRLEHFERLAQPRSTDVQLGGQIALGRQPAMQR